MKRATTIVFYWLIMATIPSIVFAQSLAGGIVSKNAGNVYIQNRANIEAVLYLESENTDRTEHRLQPNAGATFSSPTADSWFNIYVYSKNTHVQYKLDAGTRYYLEWNAAGILDVYTMPPN